MALAKLLSIKAKGRAMTKDEIIEMARQAGMYQDLNVSWNQSIQNFAKLVAAKEREACAKLAQETICDTHIPTGVNIYGTRVAKAIRARGEA
jgi:cobalamin biosynthesis Mg chelatase CobN